MSNTSLTYLIIATVGVASFALWVWLIAVPAWTAYSRVWERLLAVVMSVYVLAALLAAGGGIAAVVLFYYDQL
jgi:hypothetical protein